MRILLINPPQAQPFLPQLALPSISAVLKETGHQVTLRDLNLEAYEDFLKPETLSRSGVSSFNADRIGDFLSVLRSGGDYLNPSAYFEAVAVIEDSLSAVASPYYLTRFGLKEYTVPPYREHSSAQVLKASEDRQKNLFYDYFESKMDLLKQTDPELIGISVSWHSQLIPAITLAGLIKKHLPRVHICIGGSLIGHLWQQLSTVDGFFDKVDSFIPYEGENSVKSLADELEKGQLNRVPGLIYRWENTVIRNKPALPDIREIPFADFDGLNPDSYFSPQTYLPIAASRGCYWSRCAFCTHHLSGSTFRPRKAQSVFEEMMHQYKKHNCRNFYFVDDSLPPGLMRKVSGMIADSGLPFRWAGEIRAEKGLDEDYFRDLYRGGCRLILFGLESGCQRTLQNMQKGILPENASKALKAASEAGIITWVFFFLGFPGERRHEARETFRFIIANRQNIDMLAGGNFTLTRDSIVDRFSERFAIDSIERDPEKDLQLSYPFTLSEGMDKNTIKELMHRFRSKPEIRKYLHSFVSEPHLLFFEKSYFQSL